MLAKGTWEGEKGYECAGQFTEAYDIQYLFYMHTHCGRVAALLPAAVAGAVGRPRHAGNLRDDKGRASWVRTVTVAASSSGGVTPGRRDANDDQHGGVAFVVIVGVKMVALMGMIADVNISVF